MYEPPKDKIPEDDIIDIGTVAQGLQKQYGDSLPKHCELVLEAKGNCSGMIYENSLQAYLALQEDNVEVARAFLKVVSGLGEIRNVLCDDAAKSSDPALKAMAQGIDKKRNFDLVRLTNILRMELAGGK